jgi:acetone carboxylase gamma subunit
MMTDRHVCVFVRKGNARVWECSCGKSFMDSGYEEVSGVDAK